MSLKEAKSDKFYCESVAKSISEIIRFSLDEDFRKSSFKLFGVSSTNETEKEISKRLLSIIENAGAPRRVITSRKRRKKPSEENGKENLKEKQDTSDAKDAKINQPSSILVNCENHRVDSQVLPQSFFQKNWLQISSQQYRDVVKRRKLNYFSQPQFSQTHESDAEFSNCNLYFSNSQPDSSASGSSSLFNETNEFSHQLSDNGVNFCQKMFKVSFKDNAQKYLKKNLKSYKHFGI